MCLDFVEFQRAASLLLSANSIFSHSDNHHEDPHADLVMSKKALSLFQDDNEETKKVKKKTRNSEYYKMR